MAKNSIKLTESELKNIIKESVKKILLEGKNDVPNNTHYAIHIPSGKIIFSWDYNGYDGSELRMWKKDYFYQDLLHMDIPFKHIVIWSRNNCIKNGIDPSDDSNWSNNVVNESYTLSLSNSGKEGFNNMMNFTKALNDLQQNGEVELFMNIGNFQTIHGNIEKEGDSYMVYADKGFKKLCATPHDSILMFKQYCETIANQSNQMNEAFSDLVQHNHIMANNKDMYDAYVLIDNSDESILGNYHDMNDAIEDADYYANRNKYGSYSVVGCIDDEYDLDDERSIIYTTN
jgi:hypothetical protein